jgi:hypothetical protein
VGGEFEMVSNPLSSSSSGEALDVVLEGASSHAMEWNPSSSIGWDDIVYGWRRDGYPRPDCVK